MKKVTLCGWFGMSNLGDDAFALCNSWIAKTAFGACIQYANSLSGYFTASQKIEPIYKIDKILSRNKIRLLRSCVNSDLIIYGGGSIFTGKSYLYLHDKIMRFSKNAKKVALGVSVGPFDKRVTNDLIKRFFSNFDIICTRDEVSRERLAEYGITENVHYTFDLAPMYCDLAGLMPVDLNRSSNGIIGLSLRELHGLHCQYPDMKYVNNTIAALKECARKGVVKQVWIFDFCSFHLFGDFRLNEYIYRNLSDCVTVRKIPYSGDPYVSLNKLREVDAVIAMRMHASVFAYCLGIPQCMFSYAEKCSEFANQIGFDNDFVVDVQNGVFENDLVQIIDNLMSGKYKYPTLSVDEAHNRAWKNFDLMLKIAES